MHRLLVWGIWAFKSILWISTKVDEPGNYRLSNEVPSSECAAEGSFLESFGIWDWGVDASHCRSLSVHKARKRSRAFASRVGSRCGELAKGIVHMRRVVDPGKPQAKRNPHMRRVHDHRGRAWHARTYEEFHMRPVPDFKAKGSLRMKGVQELRGKAGS